MEGSCSVREVGVGGSGSLQTLQMNNPATPKCSRGHFVTRTLTHEIRLAPVQLFYTTQNHNSTSSPGASLTPLHTLSHRCIVTLQPDSPTVSATQTLWLSLHRLCGRWTARSEIATTVKWSQRKIVALTRCGYFPVHLYQGWRGFHSLGTVRDAH